MNLEPSILTLILLANAIPNILIFIGLFLSLLLLKTTLLDPWKLQDCPYPPRVLQKRLPLIGFNLILLVILTSVSFYFFFDAFDWQFKGWGYTILLSIFGLLVDDFYFYWAHQAMHSGSLFRKVHRFHHESSKPLPIDFLYVHPIELLIGNTGPAIYFVFLYLVFGSINIYLFMGVGILRGTHEFFIHSGFEPVWMRHLPFIGSALHHDDHHSKIDGNYASTFRYLDDIFNTKIK